MNDIQTISGAIRTFAIASSEGFVKRFCPNNRLPGVTAGLKTFPATDSVLLQLFAALLKIGVREINGEPISRRCIPFLCNVQGENYHTWWSLYIADLLCAEGAPFEQHPWLVDFTDSQRRQLLVAMDSTKVVDTKNKALIGKPNNYWIVMARLEKLRLQLGVITDETIYRLALEKSREVFLSEPTGFMDDHHESKGRFDMYTFDALHNAEPILPHIGGDDIDRALQAHEDLLVATARENGWYICWGRSVERMSLMGMEFAAMLLKNRKARAPEILLGLLANSAGKFMTEWWKDDAVYAHRRGMTHWYRGPQRLLEFSLDILVGFAGLAGHCAEIETVMPDLKAQTDADKLFPAQNRWIDFREGGPAVWCYRRGALDFMLPLVDGYNSDYVAAPLAPGLLEQPVDSEIACGVPNIFYGKKRYLPLRCPAILEHGENFVRWKTDVFTFYEMHDWWRPSDDVAATRECLMRIEGDALAFEEHWTFGKVPDAISIFLAETKTPFEVRWECEQQSQATTIAVEGMQHWRSYWHYHRRLHQLDIVPCNDVRLKYQLVIKN